MSGDRDDDRVLVIFAFAGLLVFLAAPVVVSVLR